MASTVLLSNLGYFTTVEFDFSWKTDPCRNQEKRTSTIDQIKRNELTILGAQKKGSIHSTDREVML